MSNDEIIRQYLIAQKNPDELIDKRVVEDLRDQHDASDDPIERVKIASEIERLSNPPVAAIRQEFIANAQSWAHEHNVTVNALIEEGADEDDLLAAGLIPGPAPKGESKAASKPKGDESSNGAKRGTQEDVIQHIKRTRKPFTAPQIVKATKVSRSTAAAAINALLEEGLVKDTGEEESGKRGRAAKVYIYDRG